MSCSSEITTISFQNFNPYVTEKSGHFFLPCWGDPKEDRHIQEDCPQNYQIVEVWACHFHNPSSEKAYYHLTIM